MNEATHTIQARDRAAAEYSIVEHIGPKPVPAQLTSPGKACLLQWFLFTENLLPLDSRASLWYSATLQATVFRPLKI